MMELRDPVAEGTHSTAQVRGAGGSASETSPLASNKEAPCDARPAACLWPLGR